MEHLLHARMEQSAQLLTPILSRPKLTTNADELPEAVVLEDAGAAMAGFLSLLRQLGDLAQLAAEVFHGLHDQATAVSARAHGLTLGARRLEAQLPLIEERLRRRENELPCFLHTDACVLHRPEAPCRVAGHGVDRPVIVVGGTRPCSIEKHIQRCRGPPQLSMLDKYDAGGEGACFKRYTDPSFFRAHSAEHETKPDLRSSGNHSEPPAEEAHHKKYSKFKTGALANTLRQLKYRQMISRIRRQMHTFHNQDSSEDEASEAHVLSSADSPEMSNTVVSGTAVPAADKERSSYLVDRTSSFGAWLSPNAASTHACDIIQETNADGSASHGANKADENANIATNCRSALVDFIASRVESSPRKLSVKKHSDPLMESFRNMAKKLLLENESAQNFRNNELVHSEDAPDPNEVAFYTRSTGDTLQEVTLEQSGDPCEIPCPSASIVEEASGGTTDRNLGCVVLAAAADPHHVGHLVWARTRGVWSSAAPANGHCSLRALVVAGEAPSCWIKCRSPSPLQGHLHARGCVA